MLARQALHQCSLFLRVHTQKYDDHCLKQSASKISLPTGDSSKVNEWDIITCGEENILTII
jgi:hypothetical protein